MPPPETLEHSWACLGQFLVESLLLSPGSWCTQGFVCAFQEPVSPVLCKFWWFYGGANGNLLQEGLCHTQMCCTQNPFPYGQATADPYLCRRHSNTQRQVWLSLCGLGMHFVHFPGLSSSSDQVLGECTVLGGLWVLITSLVPVAWFPGCAMRALSQMCHMSPGELISGCNPPGGCRPSRISGKFG